MRHVRSEIEEVEEVVSELSKREFTVDGTGILMLNGQWRGVPHWATYTLDALLAEIEVITAKKTAHVMVNVLEAGGSSGLHLDPSPKDADGNDVRFERWHLPLTTNEHAVFWYSEQEPEHLEAGLWHGPIEYWRLHGVLNAGESSRMHLIVDLA